MRKERSMYCALLGGVLHFQSWSLALQVSWAVLIPAITFETEQAASQQNLSIHITHGEQASSGSHTLASVYVYRNVYAEKGKSHTS